MKDLEMFDVSIEEFNNMNDKHIFSEKYRESKKNLMKEYKRSLFVSNKMRYARVAAVIALVTVATPLIANAATHGNLFARIWGTEGKQDVESHEVVEYDEVKDIYITHHLSERVYEEVDEEKAEDLIGNEMTYPSITKEIDGTTLTILSAVRDKNAGVVAFTLEKEGGVDALCYSQLHNESHGACFSDESTFFFNMGDGGDLMYVDLDKSTEDKLYCYEYMTLNRVTDTIRVVISQYPCTRGEYAALDNEQLGKPENQIQQSTISIPLTDVVESKEFISCEGGVLEISPISMTFDMDEGLGLPREYACDPANCYLVEIHYKDGTKYVVWESELEGKHTCEIEINNSSYACEERNHELTILFNRLVDVDEISSIVINDFEYTCGE